MSRQSVPFNPYVPRGDLEVQRSIEDLARLLNRPHRNEFTVACPCEDAVQVGRPQYGIVPTDAYFGGSTVSRVAGSANCTALAGAAIGTNSLKAVPFIVDHAFTLTALACQCTTLNATSKARVGIYSAHEGLRGDWAPQALIVSSGEFDCGSTGVKRTSSLSVALEPGNVYFAVFLAYTANATVNTIPVAGVDNLGESVDGTYTTHLSVAYTTGATLGLPPVFPTGSVVQTGAPPAMYLTFSQSSTHAASITRSVCAPFLDGMTLRRVRLVKSSAQARTQSAPSALIRALVSDETGSSVVGSFDTATDGIRGNAPRRIDGGADLNRRLSPGVVLQAETTQRAWPKLSMRDATVLFDVALD